MSSVNHLREFISARLTAAAEEIFLEFEKTIIQYEEVIDRQRKLLDHVSWKPKIKPSEAGVVCDRDQQTCSSGLDQDESIALHIKHEKDEILSNPDEEHVIVVPDDVKVSPNSIEKHVIEGDSDEDQVFSDESLGDSDEFVENSFELDGENFPGSSFLPEGSRRAEKLHFCSTCGKTFPNMSSLDRHVTVHTNEKPFSCRTCGKAFSRRDHLTVHTRTHTGEKPYPCKICGKSFSLSSTLLRHAKTHTSERAYSCKTCGKRFGRCSSLVRHMKTHSGARLYTCKTCGKSFSGSSHLVRHMRTHTGEKPYSCQLCGKHFSQKNNVLRHMRTHRPEEGGDPEASILNEEVKEEEQEA